LELGLYINSWNNRKKFKVFLSLLEKNATAAVAFFILDPIIYFKIRAKRQLIREGILKK